MDPLSVLRDLRAQTEKGKTQDGPERKELLEEAKNLVVALEQPQDVIERICFQALETACVKSAVEMGVFKQLATASTPLPTAELASHLGVDSVLLARVMRCLTSWGAVKETDRGFLPATVALTFANPRNEAAIETCFDLLTPAWLKLPELLQQNKYFSPTNPLYSGLHIATNTPPDIKSVFQLIFASPHVNAFGQYMGTFTQCHIEWVDLYPVKERLVDGFYEDDSSSTTKTDSPDSGVMMVDVGGGFGHQAELLRRSFPYLPGRLIVQDLAHMQGPELAGIEFMAHDFNTPQPVRGARCYYLRFIMHDYGDDRNVATLRHLRDAMTPGYSRLLVNEWIIPETGASRFMTAQDLNMMCLAGMERTELQHRAVLEAAGLRVTNIYRAQDGISESVIEAMREE